MALEHPTLLVASLAALAGGAAYLFVGEQFRRRIPIGRPSDARALVAFSVWWFALSANILIGGTYYLAASFGYTDFDLQYAYAHVQRVFLAVSLVGLMYYLLYLLTGRAFLRTLIVYYSLYLLLILYSLERTQPYDVFIGNWRTDVETRFPANDTLQLIGFAGLVLPPVVASLAYFRLVFRLEPGRDRPERYRIALVSWSIILWWVMATFAGQREALGQEEFQFVNRFFGLAAALVILAAYYPPPRVRRWLQAGRNGAAGTAA